MLFTSRVQNADAMYAYSLRQSEMSPHMVDCITRLAEAPAIRFTIAERANLTSRTLCVANEVELAGLANS